MCEWLWKNVPASFFSFLGWSVERASVPSQGDCGLGVGSSALEVILPATEWRRTQGLPSHFLGGLRGRWERLAQPGCLYLSPDAPAWVGRWGGEGLRTALLEANLLSRKPRGVQKGNFRMFPHSMKGFLFYETFPDSMTLTPSLGQHSNAPWRRQPTFRERLRDWDLGVQLEALETTLWKKCGSSMWRWGWVEEEGVVTC